MVKGGEKYVDRRKGVKESKSGGEREKRGTEARL